MQTYASVQAELEERLEEVRHTLSRDVAAAISKRDWGKNLRDRYDVEALVGKIHDFWRERGFVAEIQAAGDAARSAQTGRRGRPRKAPDAPQADQAAASAASKKAAKVAAD
ncbi:MAG: DNA-binding protein [Xanthobacteraceae bacterium]